MTDAITGATNGQSNQPADIGPLADYPDGAARRVEVDGDAVAVVRIGDEVYAIGDVCSHAKVSLSEGEVWCDELELECPKHGSAFSLLTGQPNALPATQPVAVYPTQVVDGRVQIDLGRSGQSRPGPTQPALATGVAEVGAPEVEAAEVEIVEIEEPR